MIRVYGHWVNDEQCYLSCYSGPHMYSQVPGDDSIALCCGSHDGVHKALCGLPVADMDYNHAKHCIACERLKILCELGE